MVPVATRHGLKPAIDIFDMAPADKPSLKMWFMAFWAFALSLACFASDQIRPDLRQAKLLDCEGPLELSPDIKYEDILNRPIKPIRWRNASAIKTPASIGFLDFLLTIAIINQELLASVKATSHPHTLMANINQLFTIKPTELGYMVRDLSHLAVAPQILQIVGRNEAGMNHYLYELGFKNGTESKDARGTAHQRVLPFAEPGKGDFWDLASGITSKELMQTDLEQGVHYVFFDISPYVVGYLDAIIVKYGLNAEAVQADLRALPKPDRPVGVVRMKNNWGYVKNFRNYVGEISKLVTPGGKLVFQDNKSLPYNLLRMLDEVWSPAIELLKEGWHLTYDMDEAHGIGMYTITLVKPEDPKPISRDEAWAIWEKMVGATDPRLKVKFKDGSYLPKGS